MPKYGDNKNLKQAGGIATGGQGGIDDIPALLTEGEVVLNADQQAALSKMTGKSRDQLFSEAGVPGFENNNMYEEGGEVRPLLRYKYDDEGKRLAQEAVDSGMAEYVEEEVPMQKGYALGGEVSKKIKSLMDALKSLKIEEDEEDEEALEDDAVEIVEPKEELAHAYEVGGKVGGLFDFPSKKSRS